MEQKRALKKGTQVEIRVEMEAQRHAEKEVAMQYKIDTLKTHLLTMKDKMKMAIKETEELKK